MHTARSSIYHAIHFQLMMKEMSHSTISLLSLYADLSRGGSHLQIPYWKTRRPAHFHGQKHFRLVIQLSARVVLIPKGRGKLQLFFQRDEKENPTASTLSASISHPTRAKLRQIKACRYETIGNKLSLDHGICTTRVEGKPTLLKTCKQSYVSTRLVQPKPELFIQQHLQSTDNRIFENLRSRSQEAQLWILDSPCTTLFQLAHSNSRHHLGWAE